MDHLFFVLCFTCFRICSLLPFGHLLGMFSLFCLFDLILYVPSTIFQLYRDGSSWVEPVLSWDKCVLLKDHNAVTPVRLEPAALRSQVKPSTTALPTCWEWAGLLMVMFIVFSGSYSPGAGDFKQGFDQNKVPAVQGFYLGFANGKSNIPAIPRPSGRGVTWLQMTDA